MKDVCHECTCCCGMRCKNQRTKIAYAVRSIDNEQYDKLGVAPAFTTAVVEPVVAVVSEADPEELVTITVVVAACVLELVKAVLLADSPVEALPLLIAAVVLAVPPPPAEDEDVLGVPLVAVLVVVLAAAVAEAVLLVLVTIVAVVTTEAVVAPVVAVPGQRNVIPAEELQPVGVSVMLQS